jgi:hypothetical protein
MPSQTHGGKVLLRRRQMKFHPDEVRSKIQANRLVHTLQQFIFGDVDKDGRKLADLSMPQVRAIDCLLKKVVPDLTRTLISADVNVRYVAELPKVLTKEEWVRKYGSSEPLELTALSLPNSATDKPNSVSGNGNGRTN